MIALLAPVAGADPAATFAMEPVADEKCVVIDPNQSGVPVYVRDCPEGQP